MEGMHTSDGGIVVAVENGRPTEVVFDGELRPVCEPGKSADDYDAGEPYRYDMTGVEPAMTPATLGCIEHEMLPDAWASVDDLVSIEIVCTHAVDSKAGTLSAAYVCRVLVWDRTSWRQHWTSPPLPTKAESLIACLEAAP